MMSRQDAFDNIPDNSVLLPADLYEHEYYNILIDADLRDRFRLDDAVAAWCAASLRGDWSLERHGSRLRVGADGNFLKRHLGVIIRFAETADWLLFRLRWL
jgi:hypothetical protein